MDSMANDRKNTIGKISLQVRFRKIAPKLMLIGFSFISWELDLRKYWCKDKNGLNREF